MTTDPPNNSTEAVVPEGRYECKKPTGPKPERVEAPTDQTAGQETASRKVRIDTGTNQGVRSLTVAVDVTTDNREAAIADLNKRLQKLRCKE